MNGRTYRYYEGPVQYPFGFGLSYTSFNYSWKKKPERSGNDLKLSVDITNSGAMNGDEVVQVYVKYPPAFRMPFKELKAFKRVSIGRGSTVTVDLRINTGDLMKWDLDRRCWNLYPGKYTIVVGSSSADEKLMATFII
jgi:beta-glucosidase